jgi:Photosynthetic reaction centre cytochrome C subunit
MSQTAVRLLVVAVLLAICVISLRLLAAEGSAAAPFDEAAALRNLETQIAGKEGEPAKVVFKNTQVLAGVPAGRLLRIMQMGYSRSLGVSCDHCHVAGDWASDANQNKRIARQMALMTNELNAKSLPAISELAERKPTVNCTTCHRGQKKPALSLENG